MSQAASSSRRQASAPRVRAASRPSAARAAAAARLVGPATLPASGLDPRRVGEGVRHLRAVQPARLTPAERRRRARILLASTVGLAVAVVFGLVYLHVLLAQRQFALDRLDSRVQAEQAQYQKLRLQVAELGSPQKIISTAEGQLGMVQPASVIYLTPKVVVGATQGSGAAEGSPLGGRAPQGDANWPAIKSQLAGSP